MQDLVNILLKVKEKITDKSDMLWTCFENPTDLQSEIDSWITKLQTGDTSCIDLINVHFCASCTFQEHSLMNGWPQEYLELSSEFDNIYNRLKNDIRI